MNDGFDFNSFLPEACDRRWLEKMRQRYQNPEMYKESLKQKEDEHWKQAISGGVGKEMSEKEAKRKKDLARREQAEKRADEQKGEKKSYPPGLNFPKVWDLNYFREDTQKIFKKL